MAVLFFIVSTILPGLAISTFLKRFNIGFFRSLAMSYGLGSALISLELLLYFVIARQHYSDFIFYFILAQALVSLLIIILKIKWQEKIFIDFKKIKILSWILACLIVVILFFSLVQSLGKPPVAFDSLAFWSMRAEILLKQGSVDFNPLSPTYLSALSHSNYPWHLSFMEYWFRLLGGSGGQFNLIAWLYFLSLIILVADFSIKKLGQLRGLLFTLFLASQPLIFYHASNNYADLIIGYYLAVGLSFFFDWLDNNNEAYLFLSILFTSWTFSIKNYGSFYIGALGLGVLLAWFLKIKKVSFKKIIFAGLALLPIAPWILFKIFFKLNLRNTDPQSVWHPEALKEFITALFISGNWNIWWAIFIVAGLTLLLYLWREKRFWIGWIMFSSVIIILLGVFSLTENYMWALDHTALSRSFIPLVPFSILLLVYCFKLYERRKFSLNS